MLSRAHGKAEAPQSPSIHQTLSNTKLQKYRTAPELNRYQSPGPDLTGC